SAHTHYRLSARPGHASPTDTSTAATADTRPYRETPSGAPVPTGRCPPRPLPVLLVHRTDKVGGAVQVDYISIVRPIRGIIVNLVSAPVAGQMFQPQPLWVYLNRVSTHSLPFQHPYPQANQGVSDYLVPLYQARDISCQSNRNRTRHNIHLADDRPSGPGPAA